MTKRRYAGVASLGLVLLCTGCATRHKPAEIPLGEWSGNGMYVVEKWSVAGEDVNKASLEARDHGAYPTHLKIDSVKVDGEEAIRLEILSERGVLKPWPNLGDRTRVVVLLKREDSLGDGAIALYHVVEQGLSTTEEPPRMDPGPEGIDLATCTTIDGDVVLRILYQDGFVDVIRFRDDEVCKDGAYFHLDSGFVQWSEVLR